jgi:hypothetical protein
MIDTDYTWEITNVLAAAQLYQYFITEKMLVWKDNVVALV